MNFARTFLVVLAVGLVGWMAFELALREPAPTPAGDFVSSMDCRQCHEAVFEEWEGSPHAGSWTGAEVRALSLEFSRQECIDCHAPAPVFQSGIGQRVRPRNVRQVEGVDCIACHALPEGGVAGTITDERAACRPVARAELESPEYCAGCHNQHGTVDQWRASRYASLGIGCIDCHMPHRNPDGTGGRSHRSPGGTDMDLVRGAVTLAGERVEGGWVVLLENVGAGHSFPTDERSRAADLFWRPLPEAGAAEGPWRHLHRLRDPYRQEVDLPNTLLASAELRRIPLLDGPSDPHRHTREPGGDPVPGPVEVALFYKRSPYYEDPARPDPEREAWLVHRVVLGP